MAKRREGMVVIPISWSAFLAVPAELADKSLQQGMNITREYKDGTYQYTKLEPLKKNESLYVSARDLDALEMANHMEVKI